MFSILKFVLVFLLINTMAYLAISFIVYDFFWMSSIHEWAPEERLMLVLAVIYISLPIEI